MRYHWYFCKFVFYCFNIAFPMCVLGHIIYIMYHPLSGFHNDWTCLKQSFFCCSHKDVFEWLHQIVPPCRYFLWKLVSVVLIQAEWQHPLTWPLVVLIISSCIYPLASSCAHTFNSMSARVRHMCFYLDYGAISLYTLGECVVCTSPLYTPRPKKELLLWWCSAVYNSVFVYV